MTEVYAGLVPETKVRVALLRFGLGRMRCDVPFLQPMWIACQSECRVDAGGAASVVGEVSC